MKSIAELVFVVYGLVWLLFVQATCMKHSNQGMRRMTRDMHAEMMNDTIRGPRIGQPRAWEPRERLERQVVIWSTRVLVVMAAVLYLVLQFGA